MKRETWISSLVGAMLGFFAGWCACGCLITGFNLRIDRPGYLLLAIGAAALICGLAFSLRRGGWLVPGLGAVWGYALWKQGLAWKQLLLVVYRISHIYNLAYGWPVLKLAAGGWEGEIADLPLQVLGGFVAAVCCRTVCRGKKTWPAVAAAVVPLVLCLVVTNTVPDEKWLFGLLVCLSLLVLTAAVRRSSSLQSVRLILLTVLPVSMFLGCLFQGIPREGYVNKSEEFRQRILKWAESVPARAEGTVQQIGTAVSGSSGD